MKRLIGYILIGGLILTSIPLFAQESIHHLSNKDERVTCIASSINNKVLIYPEEQSIIAYDLNKKQIIRSFNGGHRDDILSLDFSSDSSFIVSGGKDSLIVLWDINDGNIIRKFSYHNAPVLSLGISPDSRYLCSGDVSGNILLWDFYLEDLVQIPYHLNGEITCLKFSEDNKYIIWGTSEGSIYSYQINTNIIVRFPAGHKKWVRTISITSDGNYLYSGGDDNRLISWIISNQDNIRILSKDKYKSWVISSSSINNNSGYAIGLFNGQVKCKLSIGVTYSLKLKVPIREIIMFTDENNQDYIVAATFGKGVKVIPLTEMKYRR